MLADLDHFFAHFETVGPSLGPSFQNITKLARGFEHAVATVTVLDTTAMMSIPFESSYLVHPATMDACFQMAWAAVHERSMKQLGLCIPRFAKCDYLNSRERLTPGSEINVRASAFKIDGQEFEVSISVFGSGSEQCSLLMRVDGLSIKSLSGRQGVQRLGNSAFLRIEWQPDI